MRKSNCFDKLGINFKSLGMKVIYMKKLFIFVLLSCFFSTSMFSMMRRLSYPILPRTVRACANETPNPSVKSLRERIVSIDERLAELVKNSEKQNENLNAIWGVCLGSAFFTWMLLFKPVKQCRCK